CAICLSRQPHNVAQCHAGTTWDGRASRCRRNPKGVILDPEGWALCLDWQRARGCASRASHHIHECA
ncbi:hypothetical protein OF83DRAFT_1020224, partial [Amylostereum chailletii]